MIATNEMEPEMTQRLLYSCNRKYLSRVYSLSYDQYIYLAPIEKLISSERLSFIPNLYYQQYRLMEILEESRADYPEQKILVPRSETQHDHLMQQMRKHHFLLEEEVKYRKAMCFHLARSAKEEFFKKKLKKQEKYLFHRVAYSQLAEALRQKFEENKCEIKIKEKKDELQNNKKSIKPKVNDDIFMDKEQSEPNLIGGDEDLIGDLFDNPKVDQMQPKQQAPRLNTVEDYIIKLYSVDNKQRECKKVLNRKNCLKKINENIRKRIKSKLNEDSGEKNLNSATVLITALISNEFDPKQGQNSNEQLFIETPAQTEFLSNVQSRPKRKKQENFQLKWDKEMMDQFEEKNSKFEINKSKFDSNYLTTNIVKDQKQYERVFHKNIISKQPFPPSINNIPDLDSKFKINPYYNTSTDRQYEKFIMKRNKQTIFEKFKETSHLTLVDTYSNDSDSTNISKIFLNPESTFTDRVIYKVNSNKLVPVNAVHQKINLSKEQLLILSFLVRKYLGIFGSNWKIITMLILTHPNFANMYLSTEQIQQLYQIAKDKNSKTSLEQINMMTKKILPSSVLVNASYKEMEPDLKMNQIYEEMTDQSQEYVSKQPEIIDLDNYENLINEPLAEHENPKEYAFTNTAKAYEQYVKEVKLPMLHQYTLNLTENLSTVISEFEGKIQTKYVQHKQPAKINQCSDWVLDKVKNQIKFTTPVRKRKYVTDKLSELVKILHTLKQKLQPVVRQTLQPARTPAPPSTTDTIKPVTSSTPVPAPAAPAEPPIKKTLPKAPKPQDKKDKSAPKQKQQRKKKGGKDGDKQPQSK